MPAGRPTKYNEEMVRKAEEYLDTFEDYDHAFPSNIGLIDVLGISDATLYLWKHKHPEFSRILDKISRKQQNVVFTRSLNGKYNAAIAKLVLAKHGWKDKVEQEVVGKDGGAIVTDNTWRVEIVDSDNK